MKRLILSALSALVASAAIATPALAETSNNPFADRRDSSRYFEDRRDSNRYFEDRRDSSRFADDRSL